MRHSTVSIKMGVMVIVSIMGNCINRGIHFFVDMSALRTIEWAVLEYGAVSTLNTYIVWPRKSAHAAS